MRKILIVLLILISFIGGLAVSHWWKTKNNELSPSTLVFPVAKAIPNFEVINHLGEITDNSDLQGRWSLMFFGFTHCPDVCPNTLNALSNLQKEFSGKKKPQLILVTVDPMRDTPEVMNTYIHSFSEDIKGYTGELHQIQTLTSKLGVAYAYNAMPDGSYTVDHSAFIFIINPEGKYVGTFTNMLSTQDDIENLKSDFRKLSKKS